MSNIKNLLEKLKTRKVLKSLAIYAAFTFVLIQVCSIVFPSLLLPDWTMTFLIVLVIIGFPTTFILSWIYDITPSESEETASIKTKEEISSLKHELNEHRDNSKNGKTWLFGIAISVFLVLSIISLYTNSSQIDDNISIAILPFGNTIKDEDFDYLSQQFVDELTHKLLNINYLSIKDFSQVRKIYETIDPSKANIIDLTLAQKLGEKIKANYILYGNYLIFNKEKIKITCNLSDVANGTIKKSFQNTYNIVDLIEVLDTFPEEIKKLIQHSNLNKKKLANE